MINPNLSAAAKCLKTIDMHDTIVEHISKDAGFNQGYQAGIKRAWDLIGEAAEWYDKQSALHEETDPDQAQRFHDRKMTLLWAQMLITANKFTPS